ncbi:serine/threonine-protein kinase HSL1,negative regulator of Swe1 kinase [Trypanosoma rangeli]|uniref:Serine/threonine-protein kinase HSL1,negative regulator of Swe1 kinase n=1 Tax=Trypanosoma rangeli TaxID=5698 RepID=A0A3R7JVQ3_TRYRA|nr:serine/threonine-protein kinase HSL1,negative regulator of Swe1 kinase [Trypanosoma rangeli]RNE96187.1 serine/threonine-protein kinase HSL1,negative regulator of Swe1 kinase [Trypanosoma rangeli]|eukprot:RNE96187.1 serine/threonine-protein kinase HSL1,negative regulator of Swe1 kinase [Trypanosoma rangeli]
MELLSQQLTAYNFKTSAPGVRAPTKVRRISPPKHCPRGLHENGSKFWDRTPTEAERFLLPRARSAATCTRDRPTAKQKRNGQGIGSSFFSGGHCALHISGATASQPQAKHWPGNPHLDVRRLPNHTPQLRWGAVGDALLGQHSEQQMLSLADLSLPFPISQTNKGFLHDETDSKSLSALLRIPHPGRKTTKSQPPPPRWIAPIFSRHSLWHAKTPACRAGGQTVGQNPCTRRRACWGARAPLGEGHLVAYPLDPTRFDDRCDFGRAES